MVECNEADLNAHGVLHVAEGGHFTLEVSTPSQLAYDFFQLRFAILLSSYNRWKDPARMTASIS